jgi:hypothetical protein
LHFGLGEATEIDDIEVHWPSGSQEHFHALQIDRIAILREGDGTKPQK